MLSRLFGKKKTHQHQDEAAASHSTSSKAEAIQIKEEPKKQHTHHTTTTVVVEKPSATTLNATAKDPLTATLESNLRSGKEREEQLVDEQRKQTFLPSVLSSSSITPESLINEFVSSSSTDPNLASTFKVSDLFVCSYLPSMHRSPLFDRDSRRSWFDAIS